MHAAAHRPPEPSAVHWLGRDARHIGQTTARPRVRIPRPRPGVPRSGGVIEIARQPDGILQPHRGFVVRQQALGAGPLPGILRHSAITHEPLATLAFVGRRSITTAATPRSHKIGMPESMSVVTHSLQSVVMQLVAPPDATPMRRLGCRPPSQLRRSAGVTHPARGRLQDSRAALQRLLLAVRRPQSNDCGSVTAMAPRATEMRALRIAPPTHDASTTDDATTLTRCGHAARPHSVFRTGTVTIRVTQASCGHRTSSMPPQRSQ